MSSLSDYITSPQPESWNARQAAELRDRARSIAKKTGIEPENLYDFRKRNSDDRSDKLKNAAITSTLGFLIGALIGVALGGVIPVAFGAFIGATSLGTVSLVSQNEGLQHAKSVIKYEKYLDEFEKNHPAKSPQVSHEIAYKDDFAEKLTASRNNEPNLANSRS